MQEWQELETFYRDHFGDSRHAAHVRIAQAYTTAPSTVYNYLQYGSSQKHASSRSYAEQRQNPSYLPRQGFLKSFYRYPERYLSPLFASSAEALDIDEISVRIFQRYDYVPHLQTLERIAEQGNPRTGRPILQKNPGSDGPPAYKLANDVHERYVATDR